MKRQFHRIFITCCLLLTTTVIFAQQKLPGDIPTPNAASLGRFGDVPVSYYTGRPDIEIPFYTLKVRDFSLPISMSYDAGGVLVNSLPSWVGQNWTLNAGGVITRLVQGRYDEWVYPKQMNLGYCKNYYQSIGVLPQLISQKDHDYAKLKDAVTKGTYDLAPDIFSFNFCGKTGKFFLDNTGNWRVVSNENLEILFDYNNPDNFISPIFPKYPYKQAIDDNQRKTIKGFKIRDAEGYTYEFGMDINAIEFSTSIWHMSQSEQNESWHAMSWYLTRILDRYGNELITFDYKRGAYIIQAYNSCEYDHIKERASWGWYGHYGQEFSVSNTLFPYGLTISSPTYLNKIVGNNGVVVILYSDYDQKLLTEYIYKDLYKKCDGIEGLYQRLASMVPEWGTLNGAYSEGAFYYLQSDDKGLSEYRYSPKEENKRDILRYARIRRLNSISISSGVHIPSPPAYTLGFRFRYSYINNRMFLDSIQIQNDAIHYSASTGNMGSYHFEYQYRNCLSESYLTTAIDHWGYYNGKAYQIPDVSKFSSFKECRNPNFVYAKCGSLTEIQYPTGGVSVFEYEPNTYGLYQSDDRQSLIAENGIGGGLRIKSITEYDSPAHEEVLKRRTFGYDIPGTNTSSGELFATPKYYWPKWNAWCVENKAKHEVETFRTSSIIPLSNSFGPSLGYSYVTESVWNSPSVQQITQKTIYHFSNLSDANMKDEKAYLDFTNNQPSPESVFSERGFKRGKLLEKRICDSQNTTREVVCYKYRDDKGMDSLYTYTTNLAYSNNGCSASFGFYDGGVYRLYYPQYDIIEKTDTIFGAEIYPKFVSSVKYEKSDKQIKTNYPYSHSTYVRLLDSESERKGTFGVQKCYNYGDFNDKSLVTRLHKDYFYLVPSEETIYKGDFIKRNSTIYDETKNKLIVPKMEVVQYPSDLKDTLVTYGDYTSTGRPQFIKELGKPMVYLKWGYHDNYLMMKGYNYIPFSFTDDELFNEKKCLEKESSYIKNYGNIMGYVYQPFLGVIDMISPNGYIKKYSYDSIGRLKGVYNLDGKLIESIDYNYRKK